MVSSLESLFFLLLGGEVLVLEVFFAVETSPPFGDDLRLEGRFGGSVWALPVCLGIPGCVGAHLSSGKS